MSTGTMGAGSLGGASFVISAETSGFEVGLRRAKEAATKAQQDISVQTKQLAMNATTNVDATRKAFERLGSTMGSRGGRLGMGLLAVGQAVDDLQYGFRSIVNNIPQAIWMFGGSGGLAAGATVAAVAVNQLIQHWDQLSDAMQSAWLNVPAEHLEKLRLKADKAAEAFENLMKTPSTVEGRQTELVKGLMQGGGQNGEVLKAVREAVQADPVLRAEISKEDRERRLATAENLGRRNELDVEGPRRARAAEEEDIRKELEAKNAKTTAELMGAAQLPGQEGANARATIGRLIAQHAGAFPKKFREQWEKTTDQSVSHEAANREAAAAMMRGPLGTQFLLGAGQPEDRTPLDKKRALEMMKQNPVLRRMNARAKAQLAGRLEGLEPGQAQEALAGITNKSVAENAKRFAGNQFNAAVDLLTTRTEAARKAGPGPDKLGKFGEAIEKQLKGAGIEGDAKGVIREMRDMTKERVKSIMLERGVTKEQAQLVLLQEQQRRAFPHQMPAAFLPHAALAQKIQLGAFQGTQDVGKRSLDELVAIRKALTEGKQQGGKWLGNVPPAPAVAVGPP